MAPADILAPRHAFHLDSINPSPDIKYKLITETVSGMDSQHGEGWRQPTKPACTVSVITLITA